MQAFIFMQHENAVDFDVYHDFEHGSAFGDYREGIIMTKTLWGKITFALVCVCLFLYTVTIIVGVWSVVHNAGGFESVMAVGSLQGGLATLLVLCFKVLVFPVILLLIGFAYAFSIGKNKYIKWSLCMVTAVIVLLELVCILAGGNRSFWQLAPRIGVVIVFTLLFLELKKAGFRRGIYIASGCLYGIMFVQAVLRIINIIRMFGSLIAEGPIYMGYALIEYMILPVLFPVVCALVVGYALFPEKYIEA